MSEGCVFVHKCTDIVVTVQKRSKSIISADARSDGFADAARVGRSKMASKSFLTLSAEEKHP